jgi:polyisoprenoid-binding protein YceI
MRPVHAIAAAVLALSAFSVTAAPITYSFDTVHSKILFFVNHMGFSNSFGEFRVPEGTFSFDNDDFSKSKVSLKISAQSLEMRDSPWNAAVLGEFLDAAKFPEIGFVSGKIENLGGGRGKLHGDLTIRGVTQPVVLDLKVNGVGLHPYRKTQAAGFTATTTIKRSAFGVVAFSGLVGDDVEIRIEIEAFVPKA